MVSPDRWLDAQVGVLGSVLMEPELTPRVIAETQASDYSGDYAAVYQAIASLMTANQPVDIMTVRDKLGAKSAPLLVEIMRRTPTSANYDYYVTACKEQARLARLGGMAMQIAESQTLDEARALLDKANELVIDRSHSRAVSMSEAMQTFFDTHQSTKKEYLSWGIAALDENLSVDKGDFVILGGYPSDGKSAFMLQLAWHMSQKHSVGVFSFETSSAKLFDRLMSHVQKVPLPRIKRSGMSADEWRVVISAANGIADHRLELVEAAGMSVSDVLAMSVSKRYEIIFVDYLQLISPDMRRSGNRTEEVARISMALHTMAQRHGIIVIALSQLSRPQSGAQQRKTKYIELEGEQTAIVPAPTLSSLRESGQLEQDADVVMFLYRMCPGSKDQTRRLTIAKNKEGTLGGFNFKFDGSTQTFSRAVHDEITRYAAQSIRDTRMGALQPPSEDNPFRQQELPM